MSIFSRSVDCTFENDTTFTLFKNSEDFSGCANNTEPPPIIQPGQSVTWDCDNDSVPFTGVGGSVSFHIVEKVVPGQPHTDELDEVVVTWDNPGVGGNTFRIFLTSGAQDVSAENDIFDTSVRYVLSGTAQSLHVDVFPEGSIRLGQTSSQLIDIPVDVLYVGAWRDDKGTGAEWVSLPQRWDDFLVTDSGYVDQGLGLVAITTYRDRDTLEQRYSGVWADGQGTGNQVVQAAASYDDFAVLVDQNFSQDFRLVAMSASVGGYVGVWRDDRGTGPEWITPLLQWADFTNQVSAYADQGLSPIAIGTFYDPTQFVPVFVGVFHDGVGTGSAIVTPPLNGNDFATVADDNFAAGLRLVALSTFFDDSVPSGSQSYVDVSLKYVAVWRDDQGLPALWINGATTWDDFVAQAQQQFDGGMRLFAYSAAQSSVYNL